MIILVNHVMLAALIFASWVAASHAQTIDWTSLMSTSQGAFASGMAMDSTGIYVAGAVKGALEGANAVGAQDGFIRKYDWTGRVLWTRQYGPPLPQENGGLHAIAVTGDGIYAASSTLLLLDGIPNYDVFVYMFDLNGNKLWQQRLGGNVDIVPTFNSDELVGGIVADSTGVYAYGYTQGILAGQSRIGGDDFFLVKYDPAGDQVLLRQFGGTGNDIGRNIAICNGALYVAGFTDSNFPGQSILGGYDAFIAKLNSSGSTDWMRTFGSAGTDYALAIACAGNAVLVGGSINGSTNDFRAPAFADAYVRRYDTDGHVLWTRQFGTARDESGLAVSVYNNTVVVAGETGGAFPGFSSKGASDMFLRSYSLNGDERITEQAGTSGRDAGLAVIATADGVFVSGVTSIVVPGQLSPPPAEAGYLTKYAPSVFDPPPTFIQGGVVNNASFAPAPAPLAPGSIAAIFGVSLTDGTAATSSRLGSDGKLTTSLAGASVSVNNIPAPIFYATPSQLGIQIPLELAGQSNASVQVTVEGVASAPRTIALSPTAPGVFTVNNQGTGDVVALHEDGVTPVSQQLPARRNEVIVLFATGLGLVTPPITTGALSTGNRTLVVPLVEMDGITARVEFSGLAPGFAGLNQINVRIPANVRINQRVPVVVSSAGMAARPTTIFVGP